MNLNELQLAVVERALRNAASLNPAHSVPDNRVQSVQADAARAEDMLRQLKYEQENRA